jgi:hypothetical protein
VCIDDDRPAIAAIEEGEDEKDGPESPLHKGPKPQVGEKRGCGCIDVYV